jgi:signal transduction histidine kinase
MRERVRTIGASLKVESVLDEGTTIEVTWVDTTGRETHD